MKSNTISIRTIVVIAVCALGLLMPRPALAQGIDPANRWAWGANLGWLNFAPAVGGNPSYATVVYADHLEGYAWSENAGWIRLGTHTGGGAHTYGNTSNTDYGVNRDPQGRLSGFAWSSALGWINFDPRHGGVTIDANTGQFSGYAWAENAGWISLQGIAADNAGYGVIVSACATAVAPQGLTAAITGQLPSLDVTLMWADDPANTGGYRVYRSTSPYFQPDATTLITSLTAGSTSYVDPGWGNSSENPVYVIQGVNGCGGSADSLRVGVFHFSLQPGS
jgi:hypothetical protein